MGATRHQRADGEGERALIEHDLTVHYVPVEELHQSPDNPNSGDIEALEQSIDINGFFSPLLVQRSTRYILAGNHRWQVAISKGWETVPTIFLDVDDIAAKRILLADNQVTRLGHDDEALVLQILDSLQDTDVGLAGTGFTTDDLQDLVDELEAPLDLSEPDDEKDPVPVIKSGLIIDPVEDHTGHCFELHISKDDGKPMTVSDVNRIRKALGYPKLTDEQRESYGIENWGKY